MTKRPGRVCDRAEVNRLHLEHLLAAEGQELPGQGLGGLDGLLDKRDVLAPGIVLMKLFQEPLGVPDYGGEQVVEVVGHTPGKLPYRLHLLQLEELDLQRRLFLLGLFAGGYVNELNDGIDDAPDGVQNG
jgi:hypothetical protein